jgi:amino acid adenylation domain-containing protein
MTPKVAGQHGPISTQGNALSIAQERLWVLEQLHSDTAVQNVARGLRCRERIDQHVLEVALNEMQQRHEILRTVFRAVDGIPLQFVHPASTVTWDIVDLRHVPQSEREAQFLRLAESAAANPFDLTSGPLFRATVFQRSESESTLLLVAHRIVCDTISLNLLLGELVSRYPAGRNGTSREQSDNPFQYREFAAGETISQQQLSFWTKTLVDAPSSIDLPVDHARSALQTFRGAKQRIRIESTLVEQLRNLCQSRSATLFSSLLAAFNVLLSRHSGQYDLVVGTRVSGRLRPELQNMVGPLENMLALRADLSGEPTFNELLARVSNTVKQAFSHQDVPFEMIVRQLRLERDMSRHPLFQVMFTLQDAAVSSFETPAGVSVLDVEDSGESFDLSVEFSEREEELEGVFSYNPDLFDASTITRMVGHFRTLLESAAKDPGIQISRMPMLRDAERRQLLVEWNDTRVPYPAVECVYQLVEQQVEKTPDAVAVTFEGQSLSYRELNSRANRLAHYLAGRGVQAGSLVAVCMERSIDMLVAVLATLKAGAGYIPLDPVYPAERLAFMLSDASPAALLTQRAMADQLQPTATNVICVDSSWKEISEHSGENLRTAATRDDLVYVIYTSGSTGKPKGVCLSHGALTNLILWQLDTSQLPHGSSTIQFTSLSFDVSFQEIFSTWCSGGTLVLISESLRRDPVTLLRFLCQERIGRLFLPFVALQHLAEAAQQQADLPETLLEVVTAGEQLRITRQVRDFFQRMPRCKLYNHYGPSESHVVTSFLLSSSADTWPDFPPIGKPIANSQVYILDALLNPVPVGVSGELYIGGVALARGYLKRPELTAEKFIPDPFAQAPGARLYKTGDLARLRADGNIEFLGRSDHQVKIRGFRVELGEIENALDHHPAVRQSAVIVREDDNGQKWLVAYLVSKQENLTIQDLRKDLAKTLPEYMVPSRFSIVPTLPLTPSGKVDRKSLPVPLLDHNDRSDIVAPRNGVEALIVSIFQKVLKLDSVSVFDDFFDLGGHSLLAGRLLSKISEMTGRQIPLSALFRGATVESLARLIEQEADVSGDPVGMEIQHGEPSRLPFFAIVPPGEESIGYAMLARHMGPEQTVYKIQGHAPVTHGKRPYAEEEMRALTNEYVAAMKSVQPRGPYCLGGLCDGTHIAEQIVLKLESQGDEVGLYAIFDTWVLQHSQNRWLWKLSYYGQRLREMKKLSVAERLASYKRAARNKVQNLVGAKSARTDWQHAYWPEDFTPAQFRAPVILFKKPKQPFYYVDDPQMGWGKRSTSGVEIHEVDFRHMEILREPHVRIFGKDLAECVARVSAQSMSAKHEPSLVTVSSEQQGS